MTPVQLCFAVTVLGNPNAGTVCRYAPDVIKASQRRSIKPSTLTALIQVESRWKTRVAKSSKGACGITQVIPHYWNTTCRRLRNPRYSIHKGAEILSKFKRHYANGNIRIALCAYNAGKVCKGRRASRQGLRYAAKVMAYAERIRQAHLRSR